MTFHGTALRALAAFSALLITVGVLTPPAPPSAVAATEPITASATLDKAASVSTVGPGESFTYTIQVGCSSITDTGCKDAVLTDQVPAPFVVVDATVGAGANTAEDPTISGNTVTVNWSTDLGDGRIGILDATTAIVTITAQLPADVSHDVDGIAVLNNASMPGANFETVQDEVPVTPLVPLALASTATKTLTPDGALVEVGTPVTAVLGGTNTSNATVASLTITDPVEPNAPGNPFEYLAFSGFGAVTSPAESTPSLYRVFVDGAWIEAPGGVLPGTVSAADVRGTEVVFTGAIAAGATGSVTLDLVQTPAIAGQPSGFAVANTVRSTVADEGQSAFGDAAATFTPQQDVVQVEATKAFAEESVVAGESVAVALGARNTTPAPALSSMSLREPATGSLAPELAFEAFDDPVVWPAGATAATITYTFADASTQTAPFASNTIPAQPASDASPVASFEMTFSGAIQPGAETAVSFTVATSAAVDAADLPLRVPNEVGVTGIRGASTANGLASDDLYIYGEQVQTYIAKQIRPDRVLAVPGEVVTVSLTGGTTERPVPPGSDGTTVDVQQIVLQDPQEPVSGDAWWNAFDATAITQTPIPEGATLSVEYWSTSAQAWQALSGAQDVAGGQVWSFAIPMGLQPTIGGLRFVYDDPAGFAPGTDLTPNFTSRLRGEGRYLPGAPFSDTAETVVPNCAQSSASITSGTAADDTTAMNPPGPCPAITLEPVDPGNADLVDKEFGTSSSGGLKSVISRSSNTIPSVLRWSTGGYSNLDRVEITDVAAPEVTADAASVYDAFDLRRVEAITPATDPLIAFDQIAEVLLFNGSEWIKASADPCPEACVGTFPGVALSTAERESTTGVRLVFEEGAGRAAASVGNLDAPAVGSGVARSFDNVRPVTLTWQVRDERRSDAAAVLARAEYNLAGQAGVVRNTVNVTGFPVSGPTLSADDQDDVVIVDVPLTTSTNKNWSGGPVSVPPPGAGIPVQQYPLTRMTVTTRNTTPARVDQLQITDPAPGSGSDPFDVFQFTRFVRIVQPTGAPTANTQVDLSFEDGSVVTYTRTQALALDAADLPAGRGEVVGVQVRFDGRIAAGASATVELDLRLRATHRIGGAPVTVADTPVSNTAQGVIADVDPVGVCPPPASAPDGSLPRYACDLATATVTLADPSFGLDVTKSFSPSEQKEPNDAPIVMTLSGQPTGSARPVTMTITDDDAAFWNAFDFVSMDASWSLVSPIAQVQACYSAGGAFSVVAGAVVVEPTVPQCSPDRGTLAQAVSFLQDAPADVHALSFQFWSANGLGWSNPANPLQRIPIQLERRDTLRTGGDVPSTRSDQIAAPAQPSAGVFVNTATGAAQSVDITPGTPLVAADAAQAQYRYLHLQNSISVTKTPNGDVRPGVAIPFTLAFSNTGERPVSDPVFTDELPMDAQGSQLIFDPDRDPTASPYSFALQGPTPDPAVGAPLPTVAAGLSIDEQPDRIVFTPPPGTVLGVGQTYTIRVNLVLRPGLTRADSVVNTALITATEPFDDCVTTPAGVSTTECRDDATVRPLAVPALSTVKYVKATAPHGVDGIADVISDANGFDCSSAANADGFYRAPCLPVTLPGGGEQWRFTVTNAGTLPIDTVVAMDRLPAPADQGLIVPLPRGSQWTPEYIADTVRLVPTASTPVGATLVSYYTPGNACTADLNPLGFGCPAGAWLPLTADVDTDTVRAIKFVVNFPQELFEPGDAVTVQFDTTTASATSIVAARWPTAWNTVAAGGATANTGSGRAVVPATEGRRVGVTYPTGSVGVSKVVTGAASEFAPNSFRVQLVCESAGVALTGLPALTLIDGAAAQTVTGLPVGAECTATEAAFGQTSQVIGSATVGGPADETGVVSVQNIFDVTGLTITKSIDSAAVDADGVPIGYGSFDFAVACEFLGRDVYADGYGPDAPMTQSLEAGASWSLAGVPAGSECTVTETDAGGAAATSFVVTQDGVPGAPVVGSSADVVLAPEGSSSVEAINAFTTGALQITKAVTGAGAATWGATSFEVRAVCTLEGAEPETVFDGTRLLSTSDATWTIDTLPAGAECTVTETDDGGATESTIDPAGGAVTIGAAGQEGELALVTVTNDFRVGSLNVAKVVTGPGAPDFSDGPFVFSVVCLYDGAENPVYEGEFTVAGDGSGDPLLSETVTGIPVGAVCTVEETDNGAADESPAPITVTIGDEIEGQATTVTAGFTNAFSAAELTLRKELAGEGAEAGFATSAVFTVLVTCQLEVGDDLTLTLLSQEYAITGGETIELLDADGNAIRMPRDTRCFGEETVTGGATSSVVSPDNYNDGLVVTSSDDLQTLALVATNTFELGSIQLSKVVDGSGAAANSGKSFELALTCVLDQGQESPTVLIDSQPRSIIGGQTLTVGDLPIGAECWVAETSTGGADAVQITHPTAAMPAVVSAQQDVTITVTNTFIAPTSSPSW